MYALAAQSSASKLRATLKRSVKYLYICLMRRHYYSVTDVAICCDFDWRNLSVVPLVDATSPLANGSKKGSQMAPPSFLERGDKEACNPWEGRGIH